MAEISGGPPSDRRLKIVVNGGGGTVQKLGGADAMKQRLESDCTALGIRAEIELVEGKRWPDALQTARDEAKSGRFDAIVAGGGDGSLAAAAGILSEADVTMGVLPLGTVNHFSKDLGIPTELDEAIAVLKDPREDRVDLASVNGRIFTNNAVLGVHPFMVAERDRTQKLHGWSKWPAMGLAALKLLRRLPHRRLTLTVDGQVRTARSPLLFVGVNDYRVEEFDLRRLDGMANGNLWLLIATHPTPLGFLGFALRALVTGFDWKGDFEIVRARSVRVEARKQRLPVTYNGELERMDMPLEFKILPGALKVLRPREPQQES